MGRQLFFPPVGTRASSIFLPIGAFLLLLGLIPPLRAATTPPSLKGLAPPPTPGLLDGTAPIITNKTAAIALGKALFWDMAVGSDGMACASCHFHAGVDRRARNQLNPGALHNTAQGKTFGKLPSGHPGGIGYTLRRSDFPLHKLSDPLNKNSKVLFSTDDVVASSGAFLRQFNSLPSGEALIDECAESKSPLFHRGTTATRQTTPRNAPSVINAAYNFRNFWDGRANNIFNGVSVFGARDKDAGIWVADNKGKVTRQTLRLENASLASQAVGPVLSEVEMSCKQRTFPEVGRKLLPRQPLSTQQVHREDSVLAKLRNPSGKGLNTTYQKLIETAFAPRFWSSKEVISTIKAQNGSPYSQMEANFSLFFGLALQLYQQTLISDQTPFDSPRVEGTLPALPEDFNSAQARGLQVFLNSSCINCHKGPTFSSAVHPNLFKSDLAYSSLRLVNRKVLKGGLVGDPVVQGFFDEGYFNTSVTPESHDSGVNGKDPFGNTLSFTAQYIDQLLTGKSLVDPVTIHSCDMDNLFLNEYSSTELRKDPYIKGDCGTRSFYAQIPKAPILQAELQKALGRDKLAVAGAFKTPTLRNIELTGPYMHNGSLLTLEQVVDFYARGGNFTNSTHPVRLMSQRQLSSEEKADLVTFLKSLTDERVRWERAPFDHPELRIPNGYTAQLNPKNLKQVRDVYLTLPAIGKTGRDATLGPLKAFEHYLKP